MAVLEIAVTSAQDLEAKNSQAKVLVRFANAMVIQKNVQLIQMGILSARTVNMVLLEIRFEYLKHYFSHINLWYVQNEPIATEFVQCEQCPVDHYHLYGNVKEACQACDCFEDGSRDSQCSINGKCDCRPGFSGLKCEKVDQELLLWNDAFEDKIDSLDKVGVFGRFSNSPS